MAERGFATPALQMLRGSGLDTSNGADFIRRRIALFAKIIAGIAGTFFVLISAVAIAVYHAPVAPLVTSEDQLAHIVGTVFITGVWLVGRRGRFSLAGLGVLDAVGLLGTCTAWAFLFDPRVIESISGATLATVLTVLARAIVVPSKAGRTMRLTVLAFVPLLVRVGLWAADPIARPSNNTPPFLAAMNYLFWAAAAVALATITSRILYDLRRSVREANELGQYTLEEKLGAGGMGEVWRARHRFLVRAAAVKLIRPELLTANRGDPQVLLRRFEREARATAALRSPHTVQLYDFGQADDGTLFYVMEMLVGIDLEKLVSRFGPMPAERVIHILRQVSHSLDEAHHNGLTHRDIKPANVFVSCVGTDTDFVKVLDFGLVRLREDRPGADQMKITVDGAVAGTPAYAAPEIVLGEANYDHRVDMYAVGCVGYWMLTGKLVFDGPTPMKVMFEHAHTSPRPPHTRTELPIPADLEQIIMDCLEKDPARRPPSAAALAARLTACNPPEQWTHERADRWWRTHLPQPAHERPVADVLLSQEAAPAEVRELRPRRAQARAE